MSEDVAWEFHLSNCTGFCMCEKGQAKQVQEYPYPDGDFVVLGPELFTDRDGKVISWKGANYVPQVNVKALALAARMKAARLGGDWTAFAEVLDMVANGETTIEEAK